MTRFHQGPADGVSLMIKRAPRFLRVVEAAASTDGQRFDALDQLGDTPTAQEVIHVYELFGSVGSMHLNRGRGQGGCFVVATYYYHPRQPEDAQVRDAAAWQTWCLEAAKSPLLIYRPCPQCHCQPKTRRGYTTSTRDQFYAECSNEGDCDFWPITGPHESAAAALVAWDSGVAFTNHVPPVQP